MSENELVVFKPENSHGQFVSNIMKLFYPIMIQFVSHLGSGWVWVVQLFDYVLGKGIVATMPMFLWYSLNAK